jgi:hypothetical protein
MVVDAGIDHDLNSASGQNTDTWTSWASFQHGDRVHEQASHGNQDMPWP